MSILIDSWNKWINRAPPESSGLSLGFQVIDGQASKRPYRISEQTRSEHIAILGKTGTGKTTLIKSMLASDIRENRGFLAVDLHGDLTPFILGRIAGQEKRTGTDLSAKTVIVNPADPACSVGFNILQATDSIAPLISEVVGIFRRRWQLDHFGARTEELLRNCLWVLAESGMTLTELAPFLTDLSFRASLVERCRNAEAKAYFRERYEQLSDAMQTVVREAVLNKASAFTADPAICHLVGRRESFDPLGALDHGNFVILQMTKSTLGDDAETLASLVLARFRNSIFARKSRRLFTIYADEVQNLASSGSTFEQMLAEARKFSVSLVVASQHLSQHSAEMRAALLSAGTSIIFRCSPEDAPVIARAVGGGVSVERLLKELPTHQFLIRSGAGRLAEVSASIPASCADSIADLVRRSNTCWAKPRSAIEAEIAARRRMSGREDLEQWK